MPKTVPKTSGESLSSLIEHFNSIGSTINDLTKTFGKILSETDNRLKEAEAKNSELEAFLKKVIPL